MSGKLKVTMGMDMGKQGCNLSGPGTLKSALSQGYINWWTTACCHYSANEIQDKNKNKLMRESFSRLVDFKTTLHFFCKKHFNKQHQLNIWFKEQRFLVLKGVKRKININGSLAE